MNYWHFCKIGIVNWKLVTMTEFHYIFFILIVLLQTKFHPNIRKPTRVKNNNRKFYFSRTNENISRRNEKFSRSNEKYSCSNEKSSRSNENISRSNEKNSRRNEKLSRRNENISRRNEN